MNLVRRTHYAKETRQDKLRTEGETCLAPTKQTHPEHVRLEHDSRIFEGKRRCTGCALHVQISDVQCILFDELTARFHVFAH
jgi:hypothetical protein